MCEDTSAWIRGQMLKIHSLGFPAVSALNDWREEEALNTAEAPAVR